MQVQLISFPRIVTRNPDRLESDPTNQEIREMRAILIPAGNGYPGLICKWVGGSDLKFLTITGEAEDGQLSYGEVFYSPIYPPRPHNRSDIHVLKTVEMDNSEVTMLRDLAKSLPTLGMACNIVYSVLASV